MAEHTPTPWTYRPWRHDDWGWIRGPASEGEEFGPLVATARSGNGETTQEYEEHRRNGTDPHLANAAFIVKAVNNHEALVAELRRLHVICGHQHTADILAAVGGSRE